MRQKEDILPPNNEFDRFSDQRNAKDSTTHLQKSGMKIRKNIEFMGNNCLAMIALAFYNSKANFWEEIYNG